MISLLLSFVYTIAIIICTINIPHADSPIIIIEPEHHNKEGYLEDDSFEIIDSIKWGERVVDYTLEPIKLPDTAGLVNMIFSFRVKDDFCRSCQCCREIPINVITKNGIEYFGPKEWVASPSNDKKHFYSTNFQITVPPNDTSCLRIELMFGQSKVPAVAYFVTTGDLVEFWKGYPSGRYWKYPKYKPDTNKYAIRIDLSDKRRYDFIKKCEHDVGPIKTTSDSGIYIIHVTREQFNDLKRDGFTCEYLKEPPPLKVKPKKVKGQLKPIG